MAERNTRSPMSRSSLHRPRRHRAVCYRTATGTRLLPTPHSRLNHSLGWGIPLALSRVEGSQERNGRSLLPSPFPPITPHLDSHYKRCAKAERLCLRSDQSPSRPLHGRFPDKSRLALSKGHRQVRAPLTRRKGFAPSGDAPEHGVIVLPRATAPFSDSPVADLAGESEQSDERRLKTNAPFLDSTVVTTGELPTTNAGHGSPLPSLRLVERFWWTRLPHSETSSRLFHIPSEVRGCRRAVADVKHPLVRTTLISTGVDAFSHNRPGPSITSPFFSVIPSLHLSNELEAEAGVVTPASASVLLSPSPLRPSRERGIKGVRVPLWGRGASPAEALESLPQSGRGSGRIHPSRTTTYNPTPSPHPEEKRNSPKTIKNPA